MMTILLLVLLGMLTALIYLQLKLSQAKKEIDNLNEDYQFCLRENNELLVRLRKQEIAQVNNQKSTAVQSCSKTGKVEEKQLDSTPTMSHIGLGDSDNNGSFLTSSNERSLSDNSPSHYSHSSSVSDYSGGGGDSGGSGSGGDW